MPLECLTHPSGVVANMIGLIRFPLLSLGALGGLLLLDAFRGGEPVGLLGLDGHVFLSGTGVKVDSVHRLDYIRVIIFSWENCVYHAVSAERCHALAVFQEIYLIELLDRTAADAGAATSFLNITAVVHRLRVELRCHLF